MSNKKDSGRYKTEYSSPGVAMSLLDGVIETATFGAIKSPTDFAKVTDTKTDETRTGSGESKTQAKSDAYSKLSKK